MPTDHPARAMVKLARRQLARGAYAWAAVSFLAVYGTVKGYVGAYPTLEARRKIAALVIRNPAFQAINGVARRLDTPGGFVTWRVGGALMVIVAAWGLVAATRVIRGEEDDGRADMVRAGAVTGTQALVAAIGALACCLLVVTYALF